MYSLKIKKEDCDSKNNKYIANENSKKIKKRMARAR